MRIDKAVKNYLIFSGDTVLDALNRININQSRIIFVIQHNGILIGAISDGDVRRWITQSNEFDINLPVDRIMNREFVSCSINDSHDEIAKLFSQNRDIIPLTDELGRFVAIARRVHYGFQIGDFCITDESPSFIIAEIGNNHQGDIERAKQLVNLAVEAKADCVKFQMRDLASLYSNQGRKAEVGYDLSSQYTLDLLNKFQLSHDQLCQVFDYCRQCGILPLCTPWDLTSLRVLDEYGLDGFKIASADLTNFEMLEAVAKTDKPIICSTGMSNDSEIQGSISLLRKLGVSFSLLHCNSTYPTPFKDVNLNYLRRLKSISGTVIGYSGHERGTIIPLAAVAMGARIIEKHFTTDRKLEGNDHKVSLLPSEFSSMVEQIRNLEEALGSDGERELTQGELINRENLAKSLIINCDLVKGQVIQRDMVAVRSPGLGIQPNRISELLGKTAQRDFKSGDFFFESDITAQLQKKQRYVFNRPYGIPVRYHDYKKLTDKLSLDFIEFHLSYHDLELNLSDFFTDPSSLNYAVHCPELFEGDHILDLASDDSLYWNRSINELKRTISVAANLRQYFPATAKPVLVLNAGGWSSESFLPAEERQDLYTRVSKALDHVNSSIVRLAIQTMPPFPWHFGGQSHHNLFVNPDEIVFFSQTSGHKICLDISHSMMACNYYQWDFKHFLKKVLPYTIHIHLADAKGIDGEGIQMGRGDVNFKMLAEMLNEYAPNVQFIPEVWQGHKNNGEGFWSALTYLENVGI
jgi:sialic acid synthase SpsE/sugar phosphate isomerase/epimerase